MIQHIMTDSSLVGLVLLFILLDRKMLREQFWDKIMIDRKYF